MSNLPDIPVPFPEYAEKAVRVLVEVPVEVTDRPDETGYPYLGEEAALAARQREIAASRGCLTWRMEARAAYRRAVAAPEGSDDLYDALGDLLAVVASWRAAMQRRADEVTT